VCSRPSACTVLICNEFPQAAHEMCRHEQQNDEFEHSGRIYLPLIHTHGLPLAEHPVKSQKANQLDKTHDFEEAQVALIIFCFLFQLPRNASVIERIIETGWMACGIFRLQVCATTMQTGIKGSNVIHNKGPHRDCTAHEALKGNG
jgi:hypothetical protein